MKCWRPNVAGMTVGNGPDQLDTQALALESVRLSRTHAFTDISADIHTCLFIAGCLGVNMYINLFSTGGSKAPVHNEESR